MPAERIGFVVSCQSSCYNERNKSRSEERHDLSLHLLILFTHQAQARLVQVFIAGDEATDQLTPDGC